MREDRVKKIIIHHNGNFMLVEQLLKDIHQLLAKYQAIGNLDWETDVK